MTALRDVFTFKMFAYSFKQYCNINPTSLNKSDFATYIINWLIEQSRSLSCVVPESSFQYEMSVVATET